MWFKLNLTKLDFDTEARKLLNKNAITYHNKFLVSLFSRCQALSSRSSVSLDVINQEEEPKRKKQKVKGKSKEPQFTVRRPSGTILDNRLSLVNQPQPHINFNELSKHNLNLLNGKRKVMFCSSEHTLPDYFMSNLRLFVNCWEFDMDGITDDSIHLVNLAIRDFIKNIIISILTFKSDFRSCENERFKFGFGTGTVDPFLVNASTFKADRSIESNATVINENGDLEPALPCSADYAVQNALVQVACSMCTHRPNQKINLWHLYYSLKNDPTCIPTHSVKATNLERIQMRLFDEQASL